MEPEIEEAYNAIMKEIKKDNHSLESVMKVVKEQLKITYNEGVQDGIDKARNGFL